MGTIVAVCLAFLILLWVLIALRRRALRTYLLTMGMETVGRARLVPTRFRRPPRVVISYVDSEGVKRTVRKLITSAGDEQLVKQPVRVVFHADRTNRDEYVLVAFGNSNRWFRVGFTHVNA